VLAGVCLHANRIAYVAYDWATVCKTVRPMLSDRCLSALSVCDVGVLWPNGWMDQHATWCGGRPRPRPHCVIWGPMQLLKKWYSPQFSAHVCCGETAAWIKMLLGREVGLHPGNIVLDGDPAPPRKRGTAPTTFRPMSVDKLLDGPRCHLARRWVKGA